LLPAGALAHDRQPFATSEELANLAADWPAERLVANWNSLPGVTPAKAFKNPRLQLPRSRAAFRAWKTSRFMFRRMGIVRIYGSGDPFEEEF
jgi:hypothetical protein